MEKDNGDDTVDGAKVEEELMAERTEVGKEVLQADGKAEESRRIRENVTDAVKKGTLPGTARQEEEREDGKEERTEASREEERQAEVKEMGKEAKAVRVVAGTRSPATIAAGLDTTGRSACRDRGGPGQEGEDGTASGDYRDSKGTDSMLMTIANARKESMPTSTTPRSLTSTRSTSGS